MMEVMRFASYLATTNFLDNFVVFIAGQHHPATPTEMDSFTSRLRRRIRGDCVSQDRLAAFCEAHALPEPQYTIRFAEPTRELLENAARARARAGLTQAQAPSPSPPAIRRRLLSDGKHQRNFSTPTTGSQPSSLCMTPKTVAPVAANLNVSADSFESTANPASEDFLVSVKHQTVCVSAKESARPDDMEDDGNEESEFEVKDNKKKEKRDDYDDIDDDGDDIPVSTFHLRNTSLGAYAQFESPGRRGCFERLYTCTVEIRIPGGYEQDEKILHYSTPKGCEFEVPEEAREWAAMVALEKLKKNGEIKKV